MHMDNRKADIGQPEAHPIRVASYLGCGALLWTLAVTSSLLWVLHLPYQANRSRGPDRDRQPARSPARSERMAQAFTPRINQAGRRARLDAA